MRKTKELTNNQFLADKQWWIEETNEHYILFVKHKNKTYQESVSKGIVEVAKKYSEGGLKDVIVSMLCQGIELKIIQEELKKNEYTFGDKKR